MLKNKKLDDFLTENKIMYVPIRMPINTVGFAGLKGDSYLVLINEKYIQNQVKLYGCIVNVLRNNFCYEGEDKEKHIKHIKAITDQLEKMINN